MDGGSHGGKVEEEQEGGDGAAQSARVRSRVTVFINPPLTLSYGPPLDSASTRRFDQGAQAVTPEEVDAIMEMIAVTLQDTRDAAAVLQRTDAWHALRRNRVGASSTYAFLGMFDKATQAQIMISMMWGSLNAATFAMRMGTLNEPKCEAAAIASWRAEAEKKAAAGTAPALASLEVVHEGTLICERWPFLNASIDGVCIVKYVDGTCDAWGCEWKCPQKRSGYGGQVPVQYYWQQQQQLALYDVSGHLRELLAARGIDMDRDMVPGWKWRSMFAVWRPPNVLLQRQWVPYHKAAFLEHAERVRHVYATQYAPRLVHKMRGILKEGEIDWHPTLRVRTGVGGGTQIFEGEEEGGGASAREGTASPPPPMPPLMSDSDEEAGEFTAEALTTFLGQWEDGAQHKPAGEVVFNGAGVDMGGGGHGASAVVPPVLFDGAGVDMGGDM